MCITIISHAKKNFIKIQLENWIQPQSFLSIYSTVFQKVVKLKLILDLTLFKLPKWPRLNYKIKTIKNMDVLYE